jgi:hypothetical protein
MHFPKFWARGTWSGPDRTGRPVSRDAWGWSDVGTDEARASGVQKARQQVESFDPAHPPTRRYGYPNRLLREPVLREIVAGNSANATVVTRNGYGCEVLNTDRVVFVDVDLPPAAPAAGFLQSLFGRRKAGEDTRTTVEADKIALLAGWQQKHPSAGFRVYRTAAGLRYLLTSALHAPDEPLIDALFAATGADPAYRLLCRQQKTYRARLTPKYWRCGAARPPARFPYESARQIADMEQWTAGYNQATQRHATCLFLVTIGPTVVAPDARPALVEHDRVTRAEINLPLA